MKDKAEMLKFIMTFMFGYFLSSIGYIRENGLVFTTQIKEANKTHTKW